MNTGSDENGIRNIVWKYSGDFGTPQGCVIYKVNDVHPDSSHLLIFDDGPVNWAAMWDTCYMVGGAYCITGRGGGTHNAVQFQKWVDNHEILHILGACDEYPGFTCDLGKCDLKWGIYSLTNHNCEYCSSADFPCLMNDDSAYFGNICLYTREHIGLVDGYYAAEDDGPDPIQKCSHTALVRDSRMRIGDVFVAYTLDGYFVLAEPVSRWNSFPIKSTGERVLIVPNINQWRNHIACDLYMYRIHHFGGAVESETLWGGAQWESPDHPPGVVYEISIVDTTLHFKVDNVANLHITIETLGGTIICRPVCGQLFAGETCSIPLGMLLSDGQYAVRVWGYLPDQSDPVSRKVTVTVNNGPPAPPGWERISLDLNSGVARYSITDYGITQYFLPTDCGAPIDSIPPTGEYELSCQAGSKWYKTSVMAGNVNGETPSADVDSFLTKPKNVILFTGWIDSLWIPDLEGYEGDKSGPGEPAPSGEWRLINQVILSWWKPSNQVGRITSIRICHGWYNYHNAFQRDTVVIPVLLGSPFRMQYTFTHLKPLSDHTFSMVTEDEYGQRSATSEYLHFRVGYEPPIQPLPEPDFPIAKSLPSGIHDVYSYPNPFNPGTNICFHLGSPEPVEIDVYNILGQRIWSANLNLEAGRHEVRWDASDYQGTFLPAGIYIYRIRANGLVVTRKMALLK